ncbi:MAG: class I SAM-dependent methyltransferase [bacterium]|nr:class I SAM-dependent methyltransferase [bacterium]
MGSDSCHACGANDVDVFYEVDSVPVHSCLMVKSREEALAFPTGDLRVGVCRSCGFIQNNAFDPDLLSYSPDYEETQSFSPTFRTFQTELCEAQNKKYALGDKLALEIGCGKGEFLTQLCEISGGRGIGIDPGYRPERNSSPAAERIEFIVDFYSEKYTHLQPDYLACRHTLEHIQPVEQFMRMVRGTLEGRPDAIVFFELPGGERVLRDTAFWDIYYEHCTYFTLGSMARLFRRTGFQPIDLYTGYDDQYILIEARPGDPAAAPMLDGEDDLERTLADVDGFRARIQEKFATLRSDLAAACANDGKVVLWGSGSKAVSYLNTLGIQDELQYVVDINPNKFGKFLAGTGHEIVAPEFLREYKPDAVIVMNSIYLDEIRGDCERMGVDARIWGI